MGTSLSDEFQVPEAKRQRTNSDGPTPSNDLVDDLDDVYGEETAELSAEQQFDAAALAHVKSPPPHASEASGVAFLPGLGPSQATEVKELVPPEPVHHNKENERGLSPATSAAGPSISHIDQTSRIGSTNHTLSTQETKQVTPSVSTSGIAVSDDQRFADAQASIGQVEPLKDVHVPDAFASSIQAAHVQRIVSASEMNSMAQTAHPVQEEAAEQEKCANLKSDGDQTRSAIESGSKDSGTTSEPLQMSNGKISPMINAKSVLEEDTTKSPELILRNASTANLEECAPAPASSGNEPAQDVEGPSKNAFTDSEQPNGFQEASDLDLDSLAAQISADAPKEVPSNPLDAPKHYQEAEFELDSSPYQTSTDDSDSSSDSSSDDTSDHEGYELLDPAEAARRLMEDDGGSDDEGNKRSATNGHVKTVHEVVDASVEIPDIEITPEMEIKELGPVEKTISNSILIRGQTSGEYQVVDSGSLLCLVTRQVIGVVAEPLGRVQQPMYSVLFPTSAAIADFGLLQGTLVYYAPQHSEFVFTRSLQGVKGSDASNLYDEEVAADEAEFSDDEAEAEHKKQKKLDKLVKKGINVAQRNGNAKRGRPAHVANGSHRASFDAVDATSSTLNYDETEEPYTRLTRPTNLHEIVTPGSTELSQDRMGRGSPNKRPPRSHRGRGGRGPGRARFSHDRPSPQATSHHPSLSSSPQTAFPMPATPPSWPTNGSSMTPNPAPSQEPKPFTYGMHNPHQPSPVSTHPSQPGLSPGYSPGLPSPATTSSYHVPHGAPPFQHIMQGQYGQHASHGYQWQPQQQHPPNPSYHNPAVSPMLPPGAFVNPAFWSQQHSHGHPHFNGSNGPQ